MKNKKTPRSILEEKYKSAIANVKAGKNPVVGHKEIDSRIQTLIKNSTNQRAVVTALITSLVKKIENPKQDIRLHKTEFEGGYSARTYDTHYITPFLKKHLPRIAMKESGWLTRSIEQPHPFDRNFPGKIKKSDVKEAFLFLLEKVEQKEVNPEIILETLLSGLIKHLNEGVIKISPRRMTDKAEMILEIIEMLRTHFKCKRSSFLPVLAIYSMYQLIVKEVSRYKGKRLLALKSHTTADVKSGSLGDIEVVNKDGSRFECVEVKHNIKIDEYILIDVIRKIRGKGVKRYYILTTAHPEIKEKEQDKLFKKVKSFRKEDGCEIVINGVFPTLKYYLRLIDTPIEFINSYSKNLMKIYKQSPFVSKEHIRSWNKLLKGKV
ncbi:hypothetical protein J7J95_00065 [bacterium]|nr:hypothetical protein [bacterium]